MSLFNDDIIESTEILLMRKVYTYADLKLQKGHINQAFDLLVNTLFVTYSHTNFSTLVNRASEDPAGTAEIISRNMEKVIAVKEWSRQTATIAFMALKKLISETSLSPIFIQKLSIIVTPKMDRASDEYCLPSKYKKYTNNHPGKQLLLSWIHKCKTTTKSKAQSVVRQIISFTLTLSTGLGIDIDCFDQEKASTVELPDVKRVVETIPTKMALDTKIRFTTIILKTFYETDHISYDQLTTWLKSIPKRSKTDTVETDTHRLSNRELELIYDASKSNIRDELIVLVMATTGIRVGGLSNMTVANVCKTIGKDIVVNETARTREKGNKMFSFVLTPNVRTLMHTWLTQHRKAHSQYVFPGRGDNPLCTSRIGTIIKALGKKVGVEGPHVHPHAIRHTFAHLLLESGNEPGLVAKMMGHSSSKTTEMYYLKESAVEASKRCNIPWLVKHKPEPLPSFLKIEVKKPKPRSSKSEKNKSLRLLSMDFKQKELPLVS